MDIAQQTIGQLTFWGECTVMHEHEYGAMYELRKSSTHPRMSVVVLPEWINATLVALLSLERRRFQRMNLTFGVSIIALARPASQ